MRQKPPPGRWEDPAPNQTLEHPALNQTLGRGCVVMHCLRLRGEDGKHPALNQTLGIGSVATHRRKAQGWRQHGQGPRTKACREGLLSKAQPHLLLLSPRREQSHVKAVPHTGWTRTWPTDSSSEILKTFFQTQVTRASAERGAAGRAADSPWGLTLTCSESPTSATRMAPSTTASQAPHSPPWDAQMARQAGWAGELTADARDSAQRPHP